MSPLDFLVIDDDRIFREATCLLIEEEGHYAESSSTPEIALDLLKDGRFDAVLLDLNLGRQSGITLLTSIVKLRPNLPVVMLSAEGTVKAAVQALRHGALDFLEKPFTRQQFGVVLGRVKRIGELGRKIETLEEQVKEKEAQQPEALCDFDTPCNFCAISRLQRPRAYLSPIHILPGHALGIRLGQQPYQVTRRTLERARARKNWRAVRARYYRSASHGARARRHRDRPDFRAGCVRARAQARGPLAG